MATIPVPGTEGGPCESCHHPRCKHQRKTARSFCAICDRVINYETPFVESPLRHAGCAGIEDSSADFSHSEAWAENWVVELYDRRTKEILRGSTFKSERDADAFERKIRMRLKDGSYGVRVRREIE